jgi:hypothetical protein
MKKTIVLAMALIMGMAFAPMAEAAVNEAGMEMVAAKKKTVKKTTKKTTTKKSTKKTTTKAATTTAKTATATTAQAVEPAKTTTEEKAQTSSESNSGNILGGIISAVAGAATGSSNSGSSILSGLSTIFNSALGATKDRIVGTWTYTEPAVVFSSSNVLKNIGGKVASSAIEKQLEQQFEKAGIKKGAMKMTFDKDGNFTQTIGSKTMSGTYTVKDSKVTLSYAGGIKQLVGTTQLDGNDLLIVMDASKLLKYANVIGSLTGNTAMKSLGSLLGSYEGMEVGMKLNK